MPWKKDKWNQEEVYRSGMIANHFQTGNAYKIRTHRHYNGSGKKHFGGAKNWPALTVEISFEVGQEAIRDEMAIRMQKLIDEMLPE